MDHVSEHWDEALVKQTFNPEDAHAILALLIVNYSADFLSWHFDSQGILSVKSAYKLHIDVMSHPIRSGVNPNSDQLVWKAIWKFECPPMIQHFLWRLDHNSHPLRMNIARRGVIWTLVARFAKVFREWGPYVS
jgi:hypothetical protein